MRVGGYRYSPPPDPPSSPPTPGTPLPPAPAVSSRYGSQATTKWVVGLKSVGQLTLEAQISDIQGITEVYNLCIAGIPNDHKCIPGIE